VYTGWVEWQEGVKIGGNTPHWGEQGFSCLATNGTGRCSNFKPDKVTATRISCSDNSPLIITLLRSGPADNGDPEWMQWFYRGYCVPVS
jgi:hypothetical protein